MKALFLALVVSMAGCAALRPALPPVDRALCYADAERAAQKRVDSECRVGDLKVAFAECPAHDSIMSQLQADEEACP